MQLTKGAIGNLINRYKAVLKKCHLMNTFGSLAVAGMLVMGGAAAAGAADALDVALEGEKTYDSTETPEVNHLMGGWLVKEDTTTEATGDITLDVKGGTISEIIGGSYVKANSAFNGTLTHGTITTTIEGTTSSQFVVGGSKIANSENAHLKTGDISLTIKGGTFGQKDDGKNTDYELVMGGNYLKADLNANDTSNAEAGHITVNISGGDFKTSVTGGSVAHVYGTGTTNAPALSVTDASTSVTITGGTFEQSSSSGLGAIKLDPSIIGGGLALVTGEKGTASSTITGNTLVTINGGTINDKVLGGSLAQGEGAKVTVGTEGQNNTSGIVVKNVSKVGDLVGGNMAEGGTATLYGDSYVEVEAGKVEGDVMGGSYARVAGSVTTTGNTGVVFNAGNNAKVNQAEYLVGGDKVLGNGTATGTITGTSSVTVNNNASVTTGAVVGGSFSRATPSRTETAATATATVANSKVTINGGKSIAGVVGGGLAEHLNGDGSATSTVEGTSTVYVNGGNLTNIVYTTSSSKKASSSAAVAGAGFATGEKATASVGNSVVVIDGDKTAIQGNKDTLEGVTYDNQDSAKVVAGGVAVNGGSSTVTGDTRLTMTGGKVDGDLIGGGFVDMNNATDNKANVDGSTHITVNGGSLVDAEIIGGGSVRNAAGEANVKKDTYVTVTKYANSQDKQTWVQYVFGGGKAMTNGAQTATANVTGSTNVIIGEQDATGDAIDIEFGTVAGGGLARAQEGGGSAIATVKNANVAVHSGILSGVAGGGIAENYGAGSANATVTNANLTINGGTINGVKYQGVNNSAVAVLGGGIAKGAGANATVGTANTVINGGTITGHVVAGGLADGGTATVGTANLTISGNADIKDNIHAGGYALNGGTATVTDTATVTFDGNSSFAGKVFGQGHTEGSGTATVNESTLAFTNYNGTFNGHVVGFDKLDVAEGSTLKLQTLSTETADEGKGVFNNKALTLTGAGNVEAEDVNVAPDTSLSVKNGTLTVTNSLKSAAAGAEAVAENAATGINVSGNGVLSADKSLLVTKNGNIISRVTVLNKLYLGQGGTLAVTGLSSISMDDMQTYRRELVTGTGLIKYEGAAIEISTDDKTASGNLKNSVAEQTGALLTGTTVEYAGSAGSPTAIAGNYGADTVLISGAGVGHTVELNGNLTLLGDGKNLITVKGEGTPTLSTVTVKDNKALNLGSAAAPSQGGNLGAKVDLGTGSSLNAVAGDYTVGDVTGTGAVTANTGANLNTGKIDVNAVTADAANIKATDGDITANTVTLKNNGLLAASKKDDTTGGNITISNALSGQGSVVADKTLALTHGYTGAADDVLTLQAGGNITAEGQNLTQANNGKLTVVAGGTITANNITATKVAAKKLTAGAVAVDGGTLDLTGTGTDVSKVASLKLTNGTQAKVADLELTGAGTITVGTGDDAVGGTTLSAQHINLNNGMLLVDPAWESPTSSNVAVENLSAGGATDVIVNGSVGVGQNSYLALGTADTGWLPGVVGNYTKGVGLSETGITAALGVFKGITIDNGKGLVVNGSLTGTAIGEPLYTTVNAAADTATFAANSLLVVNGANIYGDKAAIKFAHTGGGNKLTVDNTSRLVVTDAVAGQDYTIVDNVTTVQVGASPATTTDETTVWKTEGLSTTTDMISLGDAVFTPGSTGTTTPGKVTTKASRNDAHTVFPNLSDGMANAVNDLYTSHAGAADKPRWDYADVNSADMGVRFLSRATDNRFLGADKDAAAATIESAARIAFAGAVPQMTKMASDAGTNAVVNRLGFANPADGAQAMDADGKIVDRNTTGFALWIAPLWQSQHGWGMEADNLDYGFNGNLGGVSLGADYTFENAIRAGITFNIGGGYAESSGGDLNSTENRMSFWGLGAYAGWNYENFGLMADVSYTSTWNDLKQDMDSRMGMGDLEADVQASAISAGLRAEYKLETSVLDVIPHIGVRYMSLNTWGFDAESNGGTVLEGDGFHQDIWTFPVGVTFTKDFTLDSGWSFKPSIDFSVIPAAGDIKARQDVRFTGAPVGAELETQMMDYLTWQGGVGLELANDNMSIGVNYTLQAGQHTTGHGVFGSFRYEF